MSVHEGAGFLSPNRISELVWDSENKEVGALSDSIIYLGNRILCIFRRPLKYLCFRYSFPDKGNIMYRLSIPFRKDTLEMMVQFGRMEQNSTKVGQSRFMTATQLKCHVWTASGVKKKAVSEVLRKYGVCVCVCVCKARLCFWHYHAKAKLHKTWSWNFLCTHQVRNRNISKINWKL